MRSVFKWSVGFEYLGDGRGICELEGIDKAFFKLQKKHGKAKLVYRETVFGRSLGDLEISVGFEIYAIQDEWMIGVLVYEGVGATLYAAREWEWTEEEEETPYFYEKLIESLAKRGAPVHEYLQKYPEAFSVVWEFEVWWGPITLRKVSKIVWRVRSMREFIQQMREEALELAKFIEHIVEREGGWKSVEEDLQENDFETYDVGIVLLGPIFKLIPPDYQGPVPAFFLAVDDPWVEGSEGLDAATAITYAVLRSFGAHPHEMLYAGAEYSQEEEVP